MYTVRVMETTSLYGDGETVSVVNQRIRCADVLQTYLSKKSSQVHQKHMCTGHYSPTKNKQTTHYQIDIVHAGFQKYNILICE